MHPSPLPALAVAAALAWAAACTVDGAGPGETDAAEGGNVDAASAPSDAGAPSPDAAVLDDCPRVRISTNGGSLRVREEPNTSSEVLGDVPNETVVPAFERVQGESVSGDTEWFLIEYEGVEGFVAGYWVACTTDSSFAPPAGPTDLPSVG